MATKLHYYGSVFELADENDDDLWRRIISSYFDEVEGTDRRITVWFDLKGGGHVSLRLGDSTPLGVQTD